MCPTSGSPHHQEMKQMIGKSLGCLAWKTWVEVNSLHSRKKLFSLHYETKKQIQLSFIKLIKHMLKKASATHSSALSHK